MSMSVRERAEAEVRIETEEKAVKLLKAKLKELHAAETIVANLKREIDDLELEIEQGNV